jgi:hypothetical protein
MAVHRGHKNFVVVVMVVVVVVVCVCVCMHFES